MNYSFALKAKAYRKAQISMPCMKKKDTRLCFLNKERLNLDIDIRFSRRGGLIRDPC